MKKRFSTGFLLNVLLVVTLLGFMASNVVTRVGLAMPEEALFQGSEEPPSTETEEPPSTETEEPDTHGVDVHLFTRQELLRLQKDKSKTVKLWADVTSLSTHFDTEDTVEVKLEVVSTGLNCFTDLTTQTQTISVRPGQRKLVSFDRGIFCAAAGTNFTAATFKVTAKHLPPGDATAESTYEVKVTVK